MLVGEWQGFLEVFYGGVILFLLLTAAFYRISILDRCGKDENNRFANINPKEKLEMSLTNLQLAIGYV